MVEQIVASHLAVGVEAGEEQMAAQLDDTACVVVVGQWLSLQSCVAHSRKCFGGCQTAYGRGAHVGRVVIFCDGLLSAHVAVVWRDG